MFYKCLLFLLLIGPLDIILVIEGSRGFNRLETCPTLTLKNGKIKQWPKSKLVKFTCNASFKLVGSKYASCRRGRWDEPTPVCIRPGCTVQLISNGLVQKSLDEAWLFYFCFPGFTLTGSQVLYCDGQKWNTSAPRCVGESKSTQLSCDFENPDMCGWMQDELHDFDWKRLNREGSLGLSYLFTGPTYDHTYGKTGSGYYMYIESTTSLKNDTARLISPIYDRSLATGCFSLYYRISSNYGNTAMNGIKVYQKPDKLGLQELLELEDSEKKGYTIFEQWGETGDFWLLGIANLTDYEDDFQIIIEGIRGEHSVNDIAFDDVAILQGQNCTAKSDVPFALSDSCSGRCNYPRKLVPGSVRGCGCTTDCFDESNCCFDFFDECIFGNYEEFLNHRQTSETVPQTQKLIIASKSDTTTTGYTTTTTTTTTTMKPTTTTQRPTTTRKIITTQKPTTTPEPTTTQRPTTTQKLTTPRKPTPTQKIITTNKVIPISTTTRRTTTKPVRTTTTTLRTTAKATFTSPSRIKVSTYITAIKDRSEIQRESVEKEKKEKYIETRKIKEAKGDQPNGSAWKVLLIIIGVTACLVGVAWLGMVARSERGRIALTRLRGTITNDAEVRFLSANMDDD